jgi:FkbM family methyltransferase
VGANIGQFNFFARHGLKASAVYSFEPIKETFEVLKLNAKTNIYNLGIASKDREQIFYMPETSLMASSCKVDDNCIEVKVACSRLDEIEEINKLEGIQLVKVDTEGSELDVIKASIPILKRSEYVLIEASVVRESSGDFVALTSYMREWLPELKMIWIGRHFDSKNGTTYAVDCLFQNCGIQIH